MPKLFYTPTSCGAASFIAAHIAGVALETETVELSTHLTASGADFYTINPKGNVRAFLLSRYSDAVCALFILTFSLPLPPYHP